MKNLHTHKKTIGWMVLVFFAFSVSMILYIERLQYRQPSIYDLTMITNNSDTSKLLLNKVCKSSRNTDVNQLSLTYENVRIHPRSPHFHAASLLAMSRIMAKWMKPLAEETAFS